LPLAEVMAQLRVVNKALPSVTHSCESKIFNRKMDLLGFRSI